tara:strand:- start:387 stop:1670 length:1284 start_codon:yes stop_codon:yes gene_type:complete
MKLVKFNNKNFYKNLQKDLNKRYSSINSNIQNDVKKIINGVKIKGDEALINYTKKFDKILLNKNNFSPNYTSINYKKNTDKKILKSFKKAIKNITNFHKKQLPNDILQTNNNIKLRTRWRPIDSVGLYIPGGNAFYPSSLIMNVVPAQIAGVKRIVCVTPPTKKPNPYLLYLLNELKISEVYFVGGAQAIAALAIGTKKIKAVNKIFGPGNAYVAEAKRQLFGKVGIDLIAGPSEIVVVADKDNNPKWVAADLMAQAEHDINAQSILITDNFQFSQMVDKEIKYLTKNNLNKNIINKSIKKNGITILVKDINLSPEIINYIAPEHLHLQIKSYKKLLPKINNAGGIFLGEYSTEAFGDYIVGTNHVLPTSGSAKFTSGLGVLDFMKRNSIVEMNSKSYNALKEDTENMADVEGLEAHKLSVKIRQNK